MQVIIQAVPATPILEGSSGDVFLKELLAELRSLDPEQFSLPETLSQEYKGRFEEKNDAKAAKGDRLCVVCVKYFESSHDNRLRHHNISKAARIIRSFWTVFHGKMLK